MTKTIATGTPVRFTEGPLGLMAGPNEEEFVDVAPMRAGDIGLYECEIDDGDGPTGWHLIRVEEWFCPVQAHQFEVIAS